LSGELDGYGSPPLAKFGRKRPFWQTGRRYPDVIKRQIGMIYTELEEQ
jgi:hypothetical protein